MSEERVNRWAKRWQAMARPWRVVPRALAAAFATVMVAPLAVAGLTQLAMPSVTLAALLAGIMGAVAIACRAVVRHLARQQVIAQSSQIYAETMRDKAWRDPVTDLVNRTGSDATLETLCAAVSLGEKVALIWLDLNRFKHVNSQLGHDLGDKVLREVADRLKREVPDGALVSRYASDEFIVAAPVPSRVAAEDLVGRIAKSITSPVRINGHRIENGASFGVAVMPEDANSASNLMKAADLALYHARTGGPNTVRFFHSSMTRALARRKEIEAELRAAIQKDELSIFFQPIIDLETGRIRSYEALVRWFHPEMGELCPDEFIPVAENTGLIITLGNWITAQAARTASTWPDEVTLAVNLSPVQIKAPGAALGILTALREAGLDPARLELEVTEELFVDDDETVTRFMRDLAEEGVCFSLDDFGTGNSSLRYIHLHPFRSIKVDRSFVSGADAGRRSNAVIRAVAEMGATLDMAIVAEGLETLEQVKAVKEAGCTLGQGWYFSRAVPDYMAALLLTQEEERLAGSGPQGQSRLAG